MTTSESDQDTSFTQLDTTAASETILGDGTTEDDDSLDEETREATTVDWRLRFPRPELKTEYLDHTFPDVIYRMKRVMLVAAFFCTLLETSFVLLFYFDPPPPLTSFFDLTRIICWLIELVLVALSYYVYINYSKFSRRIVYLCMCLYLVHFYIFYNNIAVFNQRADVSLAAEVTPVCGFVIAFSYVRPPRKMLIACMSVYLVLWYIGAFTSSLIFGFPPAFVFATASVTVFIYAMWLVVSILGSHVLELMSRNEFLLLRAISSKRAQLRAEQNNKQSLLEAILPRAVVGQLGEERRTLAETFADATVVFIALTGVHPKEKGHAREDMLDLVNQLNGVFTELDALCEKAGLEKIKTTEEVFMAAGGILNQNTSDHCERVVRFALRVKEMIPTLKNFPGLGCKVGVHSGPLVGGVIGSSKFSYDVWGDTVNTAARMKENCPSNSILVTETVYDRLQGKFDFGPENKIEVKGKGVLRTFTVLAAQKSPMLKAAGGFGQSALALALTRVGESISLREAHVLVSPRSIYAPVELEAWRSLSTERFTKYTMRFERPELEEQYNEELRQRLKVYDRRTVGILSVYWTLLVIMDILIATDNLRVPFLIIRGTALVVMGIFFFIGSMKDSLRWCFDGALMTLVLAANAFAVYYNVVVQTPVWNTNSFVEAFYEQDEHFFMYYGVLCVHNKNFVGKVVLNILIFLITTVRMWFWPGNVGAMRNTATLLVNVVLTVFCARNMEIEFRTTFLMRRKVVEEERLLNTVEKQCRKLLLNILPKQVMTKLLEQNGQWSVVTEFFDEVTFLASDVVGFTAMSATMSPRELVTILNDIFSDFDKLAKKYGVEKVKTIGDAYLVCGNCPTRQADHTRRVADMALAMMAALRRYRETKKVDLHIRVGIDCGGPVVAGVVGRRKFCYDLWGATVAKAQRYEATGVKDKIHVSSSVKKILGDAYLYEARPATQILPNVSDESFFLLGRAGPMERSDSMSALSVADSPMITRSKAALSTSTLDMLFTPVVSH